MDALFLAESDNIENIKSTSKVYKNILFGRKVKNVTRLRYYQENHVEALRFVKDNYKEKMCTHYVLGIHRILMRGQLELGNVGCYRRTDVSVGGRAAPEFERVPVLMGHWCDHFENDKNKWAIHAEFEKIHPFVDGNGRTGRLLWAWFLLRENKRIYPILNEFDNRVSPLSFAEKRSNYYKALSNWHNMIGMF